MDRAQDLAPAAELAALKGVRADVRAQIKRTKDATRRLKLQDLAVQLTRDINGILEDQTRAVSDARAEAARRTKDRIKKALEAATDFAEGLKQSALSLLDRKQGKVDWQRGITDAKEQLKLARMIGGPAGIREAQRNLQDQELARARWVAEGAVAKAGTASAATFVINGMTINGVQNVKQLIEEINKAAKRSAGQSRGVVSDRMLVR